jgi:hypothetical protein
MNIIDQLYDQSVIGIKLNESKTLLTLTEACDHYDHYYYSADLTKKEVKELIHELTIIYNQMIENNINSK